MFHHEYSSTIDTMPPMPPMQSQSHEHEIHEEWRPGLSLADVSFRWIDQWTGDPFEPIPINASRADSQFASLQTTLEETIRILFHDNEESGRDPSPQVPVSSASALNSSKRTQDLVDLDQRAQPKSKSLRTVLPQMDEYPTLRFRHFQADQWDLKFYELLDWKKEHGHCNAPYAYPANPPLARWVNRQRYQYKLFKNERTRTASTMTDQRVKALEKAGFVWDAHGMAWDERLKDLQQYLEEHGDCNVPTHYMPNQKLATWVKCQRRQYKLFCNGKTLGSNQ
jgi:hypothetical protein